MSNAHKELEKLFNADPRNQDFRPWGGKSAAENRQDALDRYIEENLPRVPPNDLRGRLAEVVRINDGELPYDEHYLATADAIIAALPDMVKPLGWHDYGTSDYPLSLGSVAEQNGAFYRISRISPDTWQIEGDLTGEYGSMESAKAAAQAHHTAAILSSLGVTHD